MVEVALPSLPSLLLWPAHKFYGLCFSQRLFPVSIHGAPPESSQSFPEGAKAPEFLLWDGMQWVQGREGPGLRPVVVGCGNKHCAAHHLGWSKTGVKGLLTSFVSWSTASSEWSRVASSWAVVLGPASLLQPHFPLNSSDLRFPGGLRIPPAYEKYSFHRASQDALQVEGSSFTGS